MGEKPATHQNLSIYPYKTRVAKKGLRLNHNYFYDDDDYMILYYDSETQRSTKEDYFKKKYGFKFIEADEEEAEGTD